MKLALAIQRQHMKAMGDIEVMSSCGKRKVTLWGWLSGASHHHDWRDEGELFLCKGIPQEANQLGKLENFLIQIPWKEYIIRGINSYSYSMGHPIDRGGWEDNPWDLRKEAVFKID